MTQTNTTTTTPATYGHTTMTRAAFRTRIAAVLGRRGERGLVLRGPYDQVEYMNAPDGLLVLAHRRYSEQVDGIHPVALSRHVEHWRNIIEPLAGASSDYAVHNLTRRQHGGLVLGAFGRQIDVGAPEAPIFTKDGGGFYSLEVFSTPAGPIVAVIESAEKVHVIEDHAATVRMSEAA